MVHQLQHVLEGAGVPRHLQTHIEAFLHAKLVEGNVAEVLVQDVHGTGDAHLSSEVQAVVVDVRDHHVLGAHVLCQGCPHDTNGARACDQNVLTHEAEGQGRVRGVAERVQESGDLVRDLVRQGKRVVGRDAEVLCEGPLAVHAHPDSAPAQVPDAGAAVPAVAADQVALTAHPVAHLETTHALAEFDDRASKFVADGHAMRNRLLGPLVPVVDVHVSATDSSAVHLYQHVVVARPGHGLPVHPDAGLGLQLRQRLHRGPCVDGLVAACNLARAAPRASGRLLRAGVLQEPARRRCPARQKPAPAGSESAHGHRTHRAPGQTRRRARGWQRGQGAGAALRSGGP
mmetsp:Transcript_12366/g.33933  ORF Transcript_12366/g.33933 Transcript_12366/m.33933 type:complete len:344 (+) Transcript_12366:432-1463(+)